MIDRIMRRTHHVIKNVPVLRRIDAWAVGLWFRLPIIRYASEIGLLLKLAKIALLKRKRLIVLCRFGGIGDIICTFPAVREFIRQNTDSQIVYVTRIPYRSLIKRSRLAIPCVTTAMNVMPPQWAAWFVKKSILLSYENEAAQTERPPVHLIEDFGRSLGLGHLLEEPVLEIDPVQVKKIRVRYLQGGKKNIILLHTGPTWKVKEWPLESWSRLVASLNENAGFQILQIVADRNVTVNDARCAEIPGAAPVKCADDVEKLIDTIRAADLLIGIDSGPIHIAGAVGTSCVALFGPTSPDFLVPKNSRIEVVFHKLECSFCHHRRPRLHWQTGCPMDIACMRGITVEQVLKKAVDLLSHEAGNERLDEPALVANNRGTP